MRTSSGFNPLQQEGYPYMRVQDRPPGTLVVHAIVSARGRRTEILAEECAGSTVQIRFQDGPMRARPASSLLAMQALQYRELCSIRTRAQLSTSAFRSTSFPSKDKENILSCSSDCWYEEAGVCILRLQRMNPVESISQAIFKPYSSHIPESSPRTLLIGASSKSFKTGCSMKGAMMVDLGQLATVLILAKLLLHLELE